MRLGCLASLFFAWRIFVDAITDLIKGAGRVGRALVDFAKDVATRRML